MYRRRKLNATYELFETFNIFVNEPPNWNISDVKQKNAEGKSVQVIKIFRKCFGKHEVNQKGNNRNLSWCFLCSWLLTSDIHRRPCMAFQNFVLPCCLRCVAFVYSCRRTQGNRQVLVARLSFELQATEGSRQVPAARLSFELQADRRQQTGPCSKAIIWAAGDRRQQTGPSSQAIIWAAGGPKATYRAQFRGFPMSCWRKLACNWPYSQTHV